MEMASQFCEVCHYWVDNPYIKIWQFLISNGNYECGNHFAIKNRPQKWKIPNFNNERDDVLQGLAI